MPAFPPPAASHPDRRRLLLGAAAALLVPGGARAQTVRSAAAFVDSVGVNVHISSEPYASRFARFRAALAESGIRHLRDELRPSNDFGRWRELSDTHGIRWTILVSPATNTIAEMQRGLAALGVGRVAAIEGQNEGDSDWFRSLPGVGDGWAARVVDHQREVFRALRGDPATAALPVLSPTVLDWKPDDVALIRAAAPFCDIVAVHAYVQHGQEPETVDDYAGLGWYLAHMAEAFKPGAPVMVTETGYNTLVRGPGTGVSERVAAIYLPRLLLANFAAGIRRTFLYEFMDGGDDPADPETHWGLVRADGTPKPAHRALAALMRALADPGRGAGSGGSVRVAVIAAPLDVRAVTLARTDGSVVLALWRALRCWDPATAREIAVETVPVGIAVTDRVRSAAVTMPNGSAHWQELTVRAGTVEVPVGAEVVLVRFR